MEASLLVDGLAGAKQRRFVSFVSLEGWRGVAHLQHALHRRLGAGMHPAVGELLLDLRVLGVRVRQRRERVLEVVRAAHAARAALEGPAEVLRVAELDGRRQLAALRSEAGVTTATVVVLLAAQRVHPLESGAAAERAELCRVEPAAAELA